MSNDQKRLLGERLREARVAAKLSQDFTAEVLGVTRQLISAWETGASCPSAIRLSQLAVTYCVCAHVLLFGEAYKPLCIEQFADHGIRSERKLKFEFES